MSHSSHISNISHSLVYSLSRCVTFGNILFKYGDRPVVLILYNVQRCLSHRLDLSDSIPSSLCSLVCGVPRIAPVIASAVLY